MKKLFGVLAALVFLVCIILAAWGGGRNFLESPISAIPALLIDYSSNETEIYIHGVEDFRFTNMTIHISTNDTFFERTRDDAYFIYYNTSLTNFTMNLTVWNKKKEYTYNGSVQIAPTDMPTVKMVLYEEKRDRITTVPLLDSNLPWKKYMERVR